MNEQWNQLEQLKRNYQSVQPPEHGVWEVQQRMEQAKREQRQRAARRTRWIAGVAAALAVFVAVPNLSPTAAAYLSDVPVIGSLVRVVTLNRYQFGNGRYEADVKTPAIQGDGSAAQEVNRDAAAYTQQLIEQFKQDMKLDEKGFRTLDVNYETVTDTDTWFTLKLCVLEIQADAYQYNKFYNIDKTTGQVVTLKDLFPADADYVTALSGDIKDQMRARMKKDSSQLYFLDSEDPALDFQEIKPDQSFYKNKQGQLVLAFDEAEVAPAYMGTQEFVISDNVLASISN